MIIITISEKRKIAKLWKKGKFSLNTDKGGFNILRPPCLLLAKTQQQACVHAAHNYNFECDWLV